MRKIISLICLLLPFVAFAAPTDAPPELRNDAPDKHIVIKGDTLWDISAKFFKDPWKWQYIWGLNKEAIKDPHWIYPGDVIYLDRLHGTLSIGQPPVADSPDFDRNIVKLRPRTREGRSSHDAIPIIPSSAISPFLSRPLIVEKDELRDAPTLIGAREGRVMLGKGDTVFIKGMPADQGNQWHIFRPGKTLTDPDTKENLGIEAVYLGRAEATDFGEVSTVVITDSLLEIGEGDRLVASSGESAANYLPHSPEAAIAAKVISIYGGVSQAGQSSVITLNKGQRDNIEVGHVLALSRAGTSVKSQGNKYLLPDERYGLALVFRVFEKVSYALVMQTRLPVQLLDSARTP